MKFHTKYLTFDTRQRRELIHITRQVEEAVRESGVQEGFVLVNAMHITASVFINDDERRLHHDYEKWLEELAPHAPTSQYQHNRTGEDNADAHLKRQVMGREVVVSVTNGRLDFGTWERILFRKHNPFAKSLRSEYESKKNRTICIHWFRFDSHYWCLGGAGLGKNRNIPCKSGSIVRT